MPTPIQPAAHPADRARRRFWALLAVAALAAGSLSNAVTANAGPITGIRVAASGMVLLSALALAARIMIALDRTRRRAARL
jgi:hypothetical protein